MHRVSVSQYDIAATDSVDWQGRIAVGRGRQLIETIDGDFIHGGNENTFANRLVRAEDLNFRGQGNRGRLSGEHVVGIELVEAGDLYGTRSVHWRSD